MPRQKKQHLKRRKDGRYCCVYHGVQFMGYTEDEAMEKREEYKRNEAKEAIIRQNPTVQEYAERWLPVASVGIRPITYNVHAIHLDHLNKIIGNIYVKEVKPSDIKKVYSTEYSKASDDYISHAKSIFSLMFASAVEDGLIPTNPVKAESAKPHKGTAGSHRTITEEERHLIETVALDHRMHAPAIVMLYAGLRPQEVKALRVEDVDFEKGIIHVRSFVHMKTKSKYSVDAIGKTAKSTRDVPLFAPVRAVLQGKKGYLLSDKDGNVATRMAWQKGWRAYKHIMETAMNGMMKRNYVRKPAGTLPPWREFTVVPYDLRHSFATWCRDNGVELHTCVEWMGHSDAQMILKIYDEVSSTRSQIEAEKLEKLLIHRQNDMQKEQQSVKTGGT